MTDKSKGHPKPGKKPDADHHLKEWSSGKRGGGKVPPDFGWPSNPKQWQEEHGSNRPPHPGGQKPKT